MSKSYNDCLSTRIRHGNATPKEEAIADAAPDLLAACKYALAHVPESALAYDQGTHGERVYVAHVLRAAIRKAEGGGE